MTPEGAANAGCRSIARRMLRDPAPFTRHSAPVAAGFVLGLVTAGHRDVVGAQLERFGIGDCCRTGVRQRPVRVQATPEPLSAP